MMIDCIQNRHVESSTSTSTLLEVLHQTSKVKGKFYFKESLDISNI